jgi:hypothetical protein
VESYLNCNHFASNVCAIVPKLCKLTSERFRGHGSVSPDERFIATSNLHDGLDIYNFPGLSHRMTLKQKISYNKPLHVAYGLSGAAIVSGSDTGLVPIYDAQSGRLLTKLPHSLSKGGFVLTICTFASHILIRLFGRRNCTCSCYHGMALQRLKNSRPHVDYRPLAL